MRTAGGGRHVGKDCLEISISIQVVKKHSKSNTFGSDNQQEDCD
jgi:hypothetical protein